jgi:L-amino acid N-acyltransferase YncA
MDRTMNSVITVRDAVGDDAPAIQRIFGYHVVNSLGTFEETPPTVEETSARISSLKDRGFPYLVAEMEGEVVGFCNASTFRPRPGYRHTVENAVYVADGFAGRGVGTKLMTALIDRCERGPWRQMIAVIGDSGNAASIALHRRLGFQPVGTLAGVGFKLGRWADTVIMQRALGPGEATLPTNGQA